MKPGEENEEEEDEEEEGSSNYEDEGADLYDDVGEGVFRMIPPTERDGSNVVMIQHNYENQDNNATTPASTRPSHSWSTSFPLPIGLFEDLPSVSESNGKTLRASPRINNLFTFIYFVDA